MIHGKLVFLLGSIDCLNIEVSKYAGMRMALGPMLLVFPPPYQTTAGGHINAFSERKARKSYVRRCVTV